MEKKDVATWSMDETKRFLSVTEDRRLYIGYVLAIHTGMRKGEILGLRWQDVDLVGKSISIRQTLVLLNGKLTFQEPKTRGDPVDELQYLISLWIP